MDVKSGGPVFACRRIWVFCHGNACFCCEVDFAFRVESRLPLQLRWLILCVRFWQSVLSLLDSELLYLAMVDNVQLFLQQRDGQSWMAQFLRALCCLGVVDSQQLHQVASFADLRELDTTEVKVKEAIDVYLNKESPAQISLNLRKRVRCTPKGCMPTSRMC